MSALAAPDELLDAFKGQVTDIINTIPATADMTDFIIINPIQSVVAQLNGNFERLQCVNQAIQARIYAEPAWAASAAVKVYELLAMLIDPSFPHPSELMAAVKGAILVRDQMMRVCQTQFQLTIVESQWSRGVIAFLGQLCTVDRSTSTTPKITLHIIDCMLGSTSWTNDENLDIFFDFLMRAGPYLDGLGYRDNLTARLRQVEERAKTFRSTESLAVYGISQLREKGWTM